MTDVGTGIGKVATHILCIASHCIQLILMLVAC